MKFEVVVELKEEVLDTQGRAIQQSLNRLGAENLKSIKVSKRFVLEVDGDEVSGLKMVHQLAQNHLINQVSETYQCRKL